MLLLACSLGLVSVVKAQPDGDLKSSVQVGMDAWHVNHSADLEVERNIMFLADSNTRWKYREVAPWLTLQSRLDFNTNNHLVLYGRASQSTGAVVDQLYLDHALSPSLGLRAGVADYRATWCREYDLDNPWVRETDPYCSDRVVRTTLSSAPALQVYLNRDVGNFEVQGIVGLYRPRAFGYAPREFGNLILQDSETVTKNNKNGLSVNVINKTHATEWRFSWIGSDQSLSNSGFFQLKDPQFYPPTQINYHQKSDTYFAGVSWQVSPRWRSRLTHMSSSLKAHCELLNLAAGEPCQNRFQKTSTVLEWAYQFKASEIVSLALSTYPIEWVGHYKGRHQSAAVAWRRDWGQGWFSTAQLIRANNRIRNVDPAVMRPYPNGSHTAWAAGLRVGYQW
jgi:hypothetical protein